MTIGRGREIGNGGETVIISLLNTFADRKNIIMLNLQFLKSVLILRF
jgi:hypothetical protein